MFNLVLHMKATTAITIILLSIGIMITAFQKKPKSGGHIRRGIHATVNNRPWTGTGYVAWIGKYAMDRLNITLPEDFVPDTTPHLRIRSYDSVSHSHIELDIPDFKNTGVYNIDTVSQHDAHASYTFENLYRASTGTITITHLSHSSVEGFFNFRAESGIIVKSGTFNLRLKD